MNKQTTSDEILNKLYAAYGTDSGILFGIKEMDIVKAIVNFTLDYSHPPTETTKEEDVQVGGEKINTTQRVATALLSHAVSEHKFVSDYSQKEKQMFRAGFIHGDVQGSDAGCIWGLNQNKENFKALYSALKRILEVDISSSETKFTIGDLTHSEIKEAKAIINQIDNK